MSIPAQGAVGAETKTAAETVTILYTNYRGETAVRRITPIAREWFGSSEWHPEPQWLFTAFDIDKEVFRDFARSGVKAWGQAQVDAALATPRADSAEVTAGEDLPKLSAEARQGVWAVEEMKNYGNSASDQFMSYGIECGGHTILDTLNSGGGVLEQEPADDDIGPFIWDEQAKRDLTFVAALVNAYRNGDVVLASATPAPSSPGVPDSVREAVARLINPVAFNTGPEAFGMSCENDPAWKRTLPYAARLIALERADEVVALLSAHPAGQSTGQGAEILRIARELVAAGSAADAACKAYEKVEDRYVVGKSDPEERELWEKKNDTLKAYDQKIDAALNHLRSLASPAPDSPLTGPVGVEELRKSVSKALHDNQFLDDWTELVDPVVDAVLAARPAAPEAQGAWSFDMEAAPRDGTPVIVAAESHHKDGEPIVGEAYIDADNGGHWWWAGESYGGYHAAPLHEVGNPPYAWHPMLDAPAPPSSGQGGR